MELCLGTVQFGMDYGIKGQKKPELESAVKCLDYAVHNGVTALDTAKAYGTAEEVVGTFLEKKTISREKLWISTKFPPNRLDHIQLEEYDKAITDSLENSLRTLHIDYVDAYLFHSARYAFQTGMLEALCKMKEKGLAKKIGVSVYEPEEAVACFESSYIDFIQVPYSIFDHRMKESGIFDDPNRYGCEIHTRSAFIQGLITLKEDQVPAYLRKARPIIRKIDKFCNEHEISRIELAMAYVKREASVSHLVFGVDSLEQLKEDIKLFQQDQPAELLDQAEREFKGMGADIVMPSLWKK